MDGIEYDQAALLNYTAVETFIDHSQDERVHQDLFITPRKLYSGVKVIKESKSGHYNETSTIQQERWHETFDKNTNLPRRSDVYHV